MPSAKSRSARRSWLRRRARRGSPPSGSSAWAASCAPRSSTSSLIFAATVGTFPSRISSTSGSAARARTTAACHDGGTRSWPRSAPTGVSPPPRRPTLHAGGRRRRARPRSLGGRHRPGHPERASRRRCCRGFRAARRATRGVRARDRDTVRPRRARLARPPARPAACGAGPARRAGRARPGAGATTHRVRWNFRDEGGGVMRRRSKRRDAKAIAHHYDVSNDFYALFLDPLMLYTCAYYREPDGKLEQAQADKVDLVCRKLRLKPGETLLDIGCGWGGLSIWATQHYGVTAHGVTLSKAQADWAMARIKREGLEGRCLVEHRDLRDLPPGARYDKIAAIGVIEHVGIVNYPSFFASARSMLNDGGLYLNHGIHHEFHWRHTSQTDFLYDHVFPNGDLSGVSETMTEMERAGWEVYDVENLRLHYARTCRQWRRRFSTS